MTILRVNINIITIITTNNLDYRCIIRYASTCESMNLLQLINYLFSP